MSNVKVIQELVETMKISGPLLVILWCGISLALVSLFKDSRYLNFLTWTIPCGSVILLLPNYSGEILKLYKVLTALYVGVMGVCFLKNILGSLIRVAFQFVCLDLLIRFFFSISLADLTKDLKILPARIEESVTKIVNINKQKNKFKKQFFTKPQ
jgi:hypothetical protein